MVVRWVDEGILPASQRRDDELYREFALVLVGPAGTGKTSVLKAAEALIDHFAGSESVRKCAISNTASRLLGGDTMHALCKLPREDLQHAKWKTYNPNFEKASGTLEDGRCSFH